MESDEIMFKTFKNKTLGRYFDCIVSAKIGDMLSMTDPKLGEINFLVLDLTYDTVTASTIEKSKSYIWEEPVPIYLIKDMEEGLTIKSPIFRTKGREIRMLA